MGNERDAAEPAGQRQPVAQRSEQPSSGEMPAEIGLGHIRDAWPVTMQEVNKQSRRVGALLNPSRPVRFEGNTLTIEVQSEFHRDTMAQEKNRAILIDGLNAALGVRPAVAFAARGAEAETSEPEQHDESISAVADAEPASEAIEDPIDLIKKGLGAEVVEEVHPK